MKMRLCCVSCVRGSGLRRSSCGRWTLNPAIGFIFSGIAWRAHLGRLLTGAAMAAVMVGIGGRRPSRAVEYGGIAGIGLVLFLIVTIRTAQLMALTG